MLVITKLFFKVVLAFHKLSDHHCCLIFFLYFFFPGPGSVKILFKQKKISYRSINVKVLTRSTSFNLLKL